MGFFNSLVGIPRSLSAWPNFTWLSFDNTTAPISFSNFGTVVFSSCKLRRENDCLRIAFRGTSGTTAGTAGTLNLPPGLTIDKSKTFSNTIGDPVGLGAFYNGTANLFSGNQMVLAFTDTSTSTTAIYFAGGCTTSGLTKALGTAFPTNSTKFYVDALVPITEFVSAEGSLS